jgi:hypothetical protein
LKAHLTNGWSDGGPACRNGHYPAASPNGQCAYEAFGRFTLSANYSIETGNILNIQVPGKPQMDSSAFFDTLVVTIALISPRTSKEERETIANEMFGEVMQLTSRKAHPLPLNGFRWNAGSSNSKFGESTVIFFNYQSPAK